MKNKIYTSLAVAIVCVALAGCKDNVDPLVEELQLNRVLTPVNLRAFVRNAITIELQWSLREGVEKYIVEFSEDSLEFNTIIFTDEITGSELPYQHTFENERRYSARVKSVGGEGKEDSKWTAITIATASENIFILPVQDDDITANETTLRWPANSEVTGIVVNPGNIVHTLTDEEKTAGIATITGLTGETLYTAKLMNGPKTRGTATFTTLIDLGGATAVNPGDDLKAMLDAAADGTTFVIFPGEYNIGSYALTKSVKLSGYKPNEKPTILGQFTCATTVASFEVKNLIVRGNADVAAVIGQFFNTVAGCNLTSLVVSDCEISNYKDHFIYNNASGIYGSIDISNSYVHSIAGGGGDGFDFRNGTVGSLTVENSTFANGFRSFLRMQVSANTSFKNCTLYKISTLDNSNNTGLFRAGVGGTLEVRNCLFVQTGVANPVNVSSGNWCRNSTNMAATPTYANNIIFGCLNLLVGLYTTSSQISATELDPGFVDAANGNFKVTNQTVIDNNVGDPRWLQ